MMPASAAQHAAEAIVDTALTDLAALLGDAAASVPSDRAIRAMSDSAHLIIRSAREARREAVGIAAHMFCNYLERLSAAGTWNAEDAGLHHDAMRRLCSDLDRAAADSILQRLLKLSQPQPAIST
jgi:hypothetical protein